MPEFRLPNLPHQQAEFDQFRFAKGRALLWQMRTGKSKACIDLACDLYKRGEIDRVLVFAPNNVHITWVVDQVPKHHWLSVPTHSMYWSSSHFHKQEYKEALKAFLFKNEGLSFFTVNSEACFYPNPKKAIEYFVSRAKKGVLFIADESQDFKRAGSKRGRFARSVAKQCAYKRILTGSGFDNSPLNAWGQFEILEPSALGFKTYGAFEAEYAIKSMRKMGARQFLVVDGFKNLSKLQESIGRWASVVLRENVEQLPALNYRREMFELSESQKKVYDHVGDKLISEIPVEGVRLSKVFEGGVKKIKLLQITNGFFIDEYGETTWLAENSRLQAFKRLVEEQIEEGNKFIVWCRFINDIDVVSRLLKEMGLMYVQFYGAIDATSRDANRRRFLEDPDCVAFVGNPKAGGRGLDLSAAKTIIWYSRDYDLEFKRQADERATHVGGANINVIDLVAEGTVDVGIIKALEEKLTISEVIDRTGLQAFLHGQMLAYDEALGL